MIPPAPAPCPGTEPYTPRTAALLAWWVTRHQLQKPFISLLAGIIAATIIAVAWTHGLPTVAGLLLAGIGSFYVIVGAATVIVHLTTMRRWVGDGWLVGYFTPNASQLVHPDNGTWVLSEHHARRRGQGHGAHLRTLAWPHLIREADHHRVAIHTATRSPNLAKQYMQEMPGLHIDTHTAGVINLVRHPTTH